MNERELHNLGFWFSNYCRSFYSSNPADQKNIVLKEKHTYNVCSNIKAIGHALALTGSGLCVAETIGLFHDLGRFPQYRKYKTFRDSISTNHAALSAKVLAENNLLGNLSDAEREIILTAIRLHNVFSIPQSLDREMLLFVKMIRDADKLDIWRVFIEYYAQQDEDRPNAAGLGLPDIAGYSPEVLASLLRHEMVYLSTLRTLNDFKLLQLAWIFDLNFTRSLQLVLERSYIEKIAATLPASREIALAVDSVRSYVDMKVSDKKQKIQDQSSECGVQSS